MRLSRHQPKLALLLAAGLVWLAGWGCAVKRSNPAGMTMEDPGVNLAGYPWIFQRQGASPGTESEFELILVGDVLAGRGAAQAEKIALPGVFQAADLLVGNLEGVLASSRLPGEAANTSYLLAGDPSMAAGLADSGFDLLGLANNHALDLGEQGLDETASLLDEAGIAWFGVSASSGQYSQPRYWQAGPLRLAFLAVDTVGSPKFSQAQAGWKVSRWEPTFLEHIQKARQRAEVVIVLVHWGYEYESQVDPAQRRLANSMLEAGADLVIGSHPHVVQGIEVKPAESHGQPKITAYSLGNFVFDQAVFDQAGMGTDTGLALRVVLDGKGIQGVQALPVRTGMQPELVPSGDAGEIVHDLLQPEEPVAFTCSAKDCSQLVQPLVQQRRETGGLFWSGWVELTGDDAEELVRREAGQVIVYQAGQEAWRTPPEWQVLDAALGDADRDGRGDILLAMLKPDASGVLRSHPFIMGYRGGIYRNLWGGSAVSDPILEVELGNVDESPAEELVVLERRDNGLQAVTVWDWHGWGFSLRWRSPEGNYQNLRLAQYPSGGPAWILVDRK